MRKHAIAVFLLSFVLIFYGSYLVLSASSTFAASRYDNPFHLFNDHLLKVIFALGLMVACTIFPYELYKKYSKYIMIFAIILLILTLFLSEETKGAHRRLDLGFFPFQTSEFAKLALIIHLAALIEKKGELINDLRKGYLYLLFWIFITALFVFIQPNVSNGSVILIIGFSVLFAGGARLSHLGATCAALLPIAYIGAMKYSHSSERITDYLTGKFGGTAINDQVYQAILGLGSGGWLGVGYGGSFQRNLFLPEAYGDFIFAILGEESGFVGATAVLLLYLVIFFCGILIATRTKDTFGKLLAFGISFMFIFFTFVNASVATGLLPTTGLPLPLMSNGGSSLFLTGISIGILANIGFTNHRTSKAIPEQHETAQTI